MKRTSPLTATAIGFLLLLPAINAQAADQDLGFVEKRALIGFKLEASDGYSVEVRGEGDKVWAIVEGHRGLAFYEVPGRSSPSGIWATFGSLGKVAMKFTPARIKRHDPPRGCEGKQRVVASGFFVGAFEFKGERGYTRARTRRARGDLYASPPWKCGRPAGVGERPVQVFGPSRTESTLLDAIARRGKLRFDALRSPGQFGIEESTLFTAVLVERRGRLTVSRLAGVRTGPSTFLFDEDLNAATVKPPRPFFGEASFSRDMQGRASWEGSLGVSLPGAEDIRLAGRHFRSRLYRKEE